jgi:gliding motility-associated lipoprotein GldD
VRVFILVGIVFVIFGASCYDTNFQPRKRGYYHIPLPVKAYQQFDDSTYPYSFAYPVYGKPVKDSLFFGEKAENPYWMNIDFGAIGGKLFLTYKPITSAKSFDTMQRDAYKLSYTHNKKASGIAEPEFHTKNNVHGIFFEVSGNVASELQFYATDSHKHFLRGALYFEATPNADSLAPASKFLIKDIEHFIETLQWTR